MDSNKLPNTPDKHFKSNGTYIYSIDSPSTLNPVEWDQNHAQTIEILIDENKEKDNKLKELQQQ